MRFNVHLHGAVQLHVALANMMKAGGRDQWGNKSCGERVREWDCGERMREWDCGERMREGDCWERDDGRGCGKRDHGRGLWGKG